MKEAVARNKSPIPPRCYALQELTVDEKIQVRTTFPLGEQIYYIQEVRYMTGKP